MLFTSSCFWDKITNTNNNYKQNNLTGIHQLLHLVILVQPGKVVVVAIENKEFKNNRSIKIIIFHKQQDMDKTIEGVFENVVFTYRSTGWTWCSTLINISFNLIPIRHINTIIVPFSVFVPFASRVQNSFSASSEISS